MPPLLALLFHCRPVVLARVTTGTHLSFFPLAPPSQINPGEVKVLRGRSQHVIYTDGTGSDNPYEKLRIKIEATRLAVKVDPV